MPQMIGIPSGWEEAIACAGSGGTWNDADIVCLMMKGYFSILESGVKAVHYIAFPHDWRIHPETEC